MAKIILNLLKLWKSLIVNQKMKFGITTSMNLKTITQIGFLLDLLFLIPLKQILAFLLECLNSRILLNFIHLNINNLNPTTMLFTVTTIRLNSGTKIFENTESNKFMLMGDIEKEFIYGGFEFKCFEDVCQMNKGQSKTFENTIYNGDNKGTRFMYVHRIS